MTDLHVQKF